jgi:serine/threonine protein kinase
MSEPQIGFRAPLPEELEPLFPKYQILSLIATGGMGAVYHAVQTSLEREVAIKILPVEFGRDPEFCEAFGAEAKAMAKLNHPNLIGVYDYGDVDGMLFIVMEYVDGNSLHAACNGSAIDPAEVIRLMNGICNGLAHAHSQGILHRDIKPANILLDTQLQPKIGDFGLARPLDAKVGENEAIYGTPGYTAPEVVAPPHTVDQRADIFSLGVLLHELLTGLLPGHDPRLPSDISRCDTRFDAIVRKATHPDPRQRYQNAADIAADLNKIAAPAAHIASRAVPRAVANTATRVRPARRQEKEGGGFLGLVLPLIAASLLVYYYKDKIIHMINPPPVEVQVVEQKQGAVKPEPEPVKSEPTVPEAEPVKPEPEPEPSVRKPLIPEPAPLTSSSGAANENSTSSNAAQPKFDVDGFITRARSVMLTRSLPEITKCDRAFESNLDDFRRKSMKSAQTNIEKSYQDAISRELDEYLAKCKTNGNRLMEQLERPLVFKPWLVELHDEFKENEKQIEVQLTRALATHKATYLQGLGIKINALRKDDPVAADLLKVELDKVNTSKTYFAELMLEAAKKN